MLLDIQGDMNAMQKTMNELEKLSDEEKAEKYVNETFGRTNPIVAMTYINIYLEGLEEGRKEVREHETTCVNRLHHIEKENAELKKDKEWLDNTNNEQTEVILQLQAQIEKMKCCRNCKHFNQVEIHCDLYAKYECVNLDKWELAE